MKRITISIAAIVLAGLAVWWATERDMKLISQPDTLELHGIADASWYGRYFHGRTTRYGERYDMDSLTTACNHLPYNTRLLVTNTANNKSVVVRVTDTGAFKKVYLDLSRAAFMAIADTLTGIITVEIRIIK